MLCEHFLIILLRIAVATLLEVLVSGDDPLRDWQILLYNGQAKNGKVTFFAIASPPCASETTITPVGLLQPVHQLQLRQLTLQDHKLSDLVTGFN